MAFTATFDNKLGTVYTLNAASSRGQGWTRGTMNASGTTYVPGGVTCTMPFINIEEVQITPRIVTATVLFYTYDITNTKVQVWQPVGPSATSGIILGGELASDTALSSLTAIRFVAWGHD